MIAIDLFCGKGGWTNGLQVRGYHCIGFDIADMGDYPGELVLQDVLTIHGSQFRNATLIVASPPCQKYSYMAMPWTRAKELAKWYRDTEHPERIVELNALFDACFRIQREASEAAGRHVPMVVENVKGAQPWVGSARWHYGPFYLWGDIPALMPLNGYGAKVKHILGIQVPDGTGKSSWLFGNSKHELRATGSKSIARKEASARIAMIPFPLARHIGEVYATESALI